MRLKTWIFLVTALLLGLAACSGLVEPAPTEPFVATKTNSLFTATPQPSPTPRTLFSSLTPEVTTAPTVTPTPALDLTPTPQTFVRNGTLIPPSEPITAENADQLVELARLGKGAIVDVLLSPDRNFLLVQTTIGVYGWLADSQLEVWGFEDPTGVAAIALPQLERWMAVATNGGDITLLITQRGSMFTRWEGGLGRIHGLAFSYDDNLLAAVGDLGVKVWEVGATEPRYHYPDIRGTAIRFTSDAEGFIVRGLESTTSYYSLETGEGQKVAGTGSNGVWEFSRDGSYLSDGEHVWNGNTGAFLYAFERPGWIEETGLTTFSYDSRYLAVNAPNDELVHIHRTSDGEEIFSLRSPYFKLGSNQPDTGNVAAPAQRTGPGVPYFKDLAFSPDGNFLAAATSDEAVEVWNLETGEFEERIPSLGSGLLFRKSSRLVVWGYNSLEQVDPVRGLPIYLDRDFNSLRYDKIILDDTNGEKKVIFSADGEWVIAENVVWHLPDGVRTYRLGGEAALAADRNGDFVYTFDNLNDTVRKRRVGNFAVVYEVVLLPPVVEELVLTLTSFYPEYLTISPDGRFLSGLIYEYGLTTWDLDSGNPIDELHGGSFTFGSEFSPDTQYLYICGNDGMDIYRLDTYQQAFSIETDYSCFGDVMNFTMDGRYLVVNENGIEGYWVYPDHLEQVLRLDQRADKLAISPDNSVIAHSVDAQLKLLELETGVMIAEIAAHTGEILDITFSPDGRYIATSSWDGTVRIWGIPPQD